MDRERIYRSEAIVLRRHDFGESDRLLTLFSRDYGKIRVVAKGARKTLSRKAGHIELFMRSKMLFARGRNLDLVTQVELVEAYLPLREDLVRMTYASHAVELLDRFTAENDAHPELFKLLAEGLGWLAESQDLLLTARYYELRLLSLVGFELRLFQCAHCDAVLQPQDQFFSAEQGGVLCPECHWVDERVLPITLNALKVLRYLQTRPYSSVQNLRIRRALHAELETIMHRTLEHILERRLKSVDFLKRLRVEAGVNIK
ncbi:MAG: DNA repair protein RecO [Anaerolineales bacterium]|nr:DNA repair protein RecO [Anaerolineales bacterium]